MNKLIGWGVNLFVGKKGMKFSFRFSKHIKPTYSDKKKRQKDQNKIGLKANFQKGRTAKPFWQFEGGMAPSSSRSKEYMHVIIGNAVKSWMKQIQVMKFNLKKIIEELSLRNSSHTQLTSMDIYHCKFPHNNMSF